MLPIWEIDNLKRHLPTTENLDLFLFFIRAMAASSTSSGNSGTEKDGTLGLNRKDHNALEAELPEYTPGRAFETAGLETHYEPIDSYEGKHRYDPGFKWTENEEQKVVRKVSRSCFKDRISKLIRD